MDFDYILYIIFNVSTTWAAPEVYKDIKKALSYIKN